MTKKQRAKRDIKIMELRGTLTAREIADKFEIDQATVFRVFKKSAELERKEHDQN